MLKTDSYQKGGWFKDGHKEGQWVLHILSRYLLGGCSYDQWETYTCRQPCCQQASIVLPYFDEHMRELQVQYMGKSEAWIIKQHKDHFDNIGYENTWWENW